MKSDTTNTILTFFLGALALLGVIFALQTIFRTRELRALQIQVNMNSAKLMGVQSLFQETVAYNQKYPSPELTRILGPLPPTH